MEGMGWRFWGGLIGTVFGVCVGGLIFFLVFGWAWATFGFIAAFAVLGGALVLVGYIYDRREENERRELSA